MIRVRLEPIGTRRGVARDIGFAFNLANPADAAAPRPYLWNR
jgi:hypothetical protein